MRKSFALIAATFLMIPGFLLAQIQVSGTVTDAQTGDKLVGANVIVEGTDTGTSTDVDGNYSVTVPAGLTSAKLTARYIGYKQSTVTVSESGTTRFQSSRRCFEDGCSHGYWCCWRINKDQNTFCD